MYRRICLLRAQSRLIEADHVDAAEWSPLLVSLREAGGFDEDRFRALCVAEQERVNNAVLMAELIKPLILATLTPMLPNDSAPPLSPLPANDLRRTPPGSGLSIADLLDGMLAQEHASHRDP